MEAEKIADLRVKHLEMLQILIARMATYSANIKNYCLTVVVALSGFSLNGRAPLVILIGIVAAIIFALLDASYLRLERVYRSLFDEVRAENWDIPPDFRLGPASVQNQDFMEVMQSWSVRYFYAPVIFVALMLMFVLRVIYGYF